MATVLRKENITISVGEYQKDGATKQEYRTIGELVTMQGDDGSVYQFGKLWGATGSTKFNVYEQQDKNAQAPQQNAGQQFQQPQQAPQQQYQQAPQQYAQQPNQTYQQK